MQGAIWELVLEPDYEDERDALEPDFSANVGGGSLDSANLAALVARVGVLSHAQKVNRKELGGVVLDAY